MTSSAAHVRQQSLFKPTSKNGLFASEQLSHLPLFVSMKFLYDSMKFITPDMVALSNKQSENQTKQCQNKWNSHTHNTKLILTARIRRLNDLNLNVFVLTSVFSILFHILLLGLLVRVAHHNKPRCVLHTSIIIESES